MNDEEKQLIVCSTSLAEHYIREEEYEKCFECYRALLEACGTLNTFLHPYLLDVLKKWVNHFCVTCAEDGIEDVEKVEEIKSIVNAHITAAKLSDEPHWIICSCANLFFRLRQNLTALEYFREAVKVCPSSLFARESLENLNCKLVNRWHFVMLNDSNRNKQYQKAIQNAISSLCNSLTMPSSLFSKSAPAIIMDVGGGTARALCTLGMGDLMKIKCYEEDECMFQVAMKVVQHNNVQNVVDLICESTDNIKPSSTSESIKYPFVSFVVQLLIITETFDGGLLGEGAITSLHHLLHLPQCSPNVKVIPQSATLYMCLVECLDVRNFARYSSTVTNFGCRIFCNIGHHLHHHPPHRRPRHYQPYTTEYIHSFNHSCKNLSAVVPFQCINFNILQELESYMMGITDQLKVSITSPGKLDAIVTWFDLHLDDDHHLSSSPLPSHLGSDESSASCWQQALHPICLLADESSYIVHASDHVLIQFKINNEMLQVDCLEISRKHKNIEHNDASDRTRINDDFASNDCRNSLTKTALTSSVIHHFSSSASAKITSSTATTTTTTFTTTTTSTTTTATAVHSHRRNTTHPHLPTTSQHSTSTVFSPSSFQHAAVTDDSPEDILSTSFTPIIYLSPNDVSLLNDDEYNIKCIKYLGKIIQHYLLENVPADKNNDHQNNDASKHNNSNICNSSNDANNHQTNNACSNDIGCCINDTPNNYKVDNSRNGMFLGVVIVSSSHLDASSLHIIHAFCDKVHFRIIYTGEDVDGDDQEVDDWPSDVSELLNLIRKIYESKKVDYGKMFSFVKLFADGKTENIMTLTGDNNNNILEERLTDDIDVNWVIGFANLVGANGQIKSHILNSVNICKKSCLSLNCTFLPYEVSCMGQLISSPHLVRRCSMHKTNNPAPYQISQFINEFKVSYHTDVNMNALQCVKLTEPFQMFMFKLNEAFGEVCGKVKEDAEDVVDGDDDAGNKDSDEEDDDEDNDNEGTFFCNLHERISNPGIIHALVYWFVIKLGRGGDDDNYGGNDDDDVISTASPRCHWKQSAVIIDTPLHVILNDTVNVKVRSSKSAEYFCVQLNKD
ncbi:hypothetical protein HELRODRAFT_187900 [Helobdella robusta]|uniref:Uncharacterized protein n=1 Tax=Helobdella robusta TaxID=6412 RepID=T1FPG5_HELRO|nr:hypothetical protein HELRODRAFT_187900 [Helobdella robusta]ESO12493.1 hypothetical protein HELRODRAFT_187900 [Helobdella robusta]